MQLVTILMLLLTATKNGLHTKQWKHTLKINQCTCMIMRFKMDLQGNGDLISEVENIVDIGEDVEIIAPEIVPGAEYVYVGQHRLVDGVKLQTTDSVNVNAD